MGTSSRWVGFLYKIAYVTNWKPPPKNQPNPLTAKFPKLLVLCKQTFRLSSVGNFISGDPPWSGRGVEGGGISAKVPPPKLSVKMSGNKRQIIRKISGNCDFFHNLHIFGHPPINSFQAFLHQFGAMFRDISKHFWPSLIILTVLNHLGSFQDILSHFNQYSPYRNHFTTKRTKVSKK